MQVELLSDATQFTRRAEGAVAADPVSTSVIAGMLAGVRDGTRTAPPGTVWMAVLDNGNVVGVAMHTPPYPPFLPRLPPRAGAAVALELLLDQSTNSRPDPESRKPGTLHSRATSLPHSY